MWMRNFDNNSVPLWREMNRIRREMDRLLEGTPNFIAAPAFPALNVWSNEEGATITAEIPGITPEDVDISVVGETLTLKGTRRPEEGNENGKYHRRERGYGDFNRTLQLPFRIETDRVEATFDKGILSVLLPRAEADKPKKISVKARTA